MKKFTRHKTAAEVMLQCALKKIEIDAIQHERGSDYLVVHLPGPSGAAIPVMYSTINGRFFHYDLDRDEGHDDFSSDDASLDGKAWFDYMLDLFMSDLPASETIPVTLHLSDEVIQNLFTVARNCTVSHQANDGFTSHGELDITGLLTMLAQDAAMTNSRPGSWEGANMQNVLTSHGYR